MSKRFRLFVFAGLATAVTLAGLTGYALSRSQAPKSTATAAATAPPQVPMWFERNTDAYPAQVLYASRSIQQTVFLTSSAMVLATPSGAKLSIEWRGGKPAKTISGQQPLRARVDYFRGAERTKWRAGQDATRYGSVRYGEVYDGIDLVFHPKGSQLEHDFVVTPGADPQKINLAFEGASSMSLGADGSLLLQVGKDSVRQSKPVAYQEIDGKRVSVEAAFRLTGEREAAFELGQYDRSRELVIDPVLQYASYLGGSNFTSPVSVITEPTTGIVWVAGTTASTDFPIVGTPIRETGFGNRDIFIAKIDPSKANVDSLLYAAFVGGTGTDEARSMSLDRDGNALIAGTTTSGDFPIVGSYNTTIGGGRDAFVIKVDPRRDGPDALVYTTLIGGDGEDFAMAVTADALNKIILAGYTVSENFPVTANAIQSNRQSGYELFISKIDPDAGTSGLMYSTYYGGSGTDIPHAVAVNAAGLIYVAGSTTSSNFPIGDRAFQPAYSGAGDMFLIRIDPSKSGINGIDVGTYIGGSGIDSAEAMVLSADGNSVYVAGYTTSTDMPVAGSGPQTRNAGGADAYVIRIGVPSNEVSFAGYLGGSATDVAYGLAVDNAGRIHITGYTYSNDFNVTRNALQSKANGIPDAFMATMNPALPAAESLLYSSYVGSAGLDYGYGISADNNCVVSVTGSTTGKKFTVTDSGYQREASGYPDMFLTSVNICR